MNKKFLIVCDVEGTIFQAKYKLGNTMYASTMWQPIAEKLGSNAMREESESEYRWNNNGYATYADWVEDTTHIHKKYGLKKNVFDEVLNAALYMPGVEEFFKKLDKEKYVTLFVSGGFQNLIDKAIDELKIDFGYGACKYSFDAEGNMLEPEINRETDFEAKINYVKRILKSIDGDFDDGWAFFGDGYNDYSIAEAAPYKFGINCHQELLSIKGLTPIDSFMDAYEEIEIAYDIMIEKHNNKAKNRQNVKQIEHDIKQSRKKQKDLEIEMLKTEIDDLEVQIRGLYKKLPLPTNKSQSIVLNEYYKKDYEVPEIENLKSRDEKIKVLTEIKAQMIEYRHRLQARPAPVNAKQVIIFAELFWGEYIEFSKEALETMYKTNEEGYIAKNYTYIFNELWKIVLWVQMKKGHITLQKYESLVTDRMISPALSEGEKGRAKSGNITKNGHSYYADGKLMNMHLRLKELPKCHDPRVYFAWDDMKRKAIIGSMFIHN